MNKETKRVVFILTMFCLVFIGLVVYLSYFQLFQAEAIKNNSHNKRLWINEENVLRGSILDRNDNILAYSEKTEDKNRRYYEYGRLYSHIIGYSYREYGKVGLELSYNNELLNIGENTALNEIKNLVLPSSIGNNLRLTIDHGLQEKAHSLLKGRKGSIVVMNPKTGEIYSMISLPDFDPSNLTESWKDISESTDSPLMNRALQGLYEPGSTFKVITASAALETPGLDLNYKCKGSTKIDGHTFNDYNKTAHGNITLKAAIAKSCNTYFAEKSLIIGRDKLTSKAEDFMINNKIPFDLPVKTSKFPNKGNLGKTMIASSAMGQGDVLVTPLYMSMVASTIANDGLMVKPILVKEVLDKNNKVISRQEGEILTQSIDGAIANEIKEMMLEAVKSGTATNARIKNVMLGGKTGTAENPSGKDHGWFIGFAPYDNPQLAVSVIVEEANLTGGKVAAPIARDLIIYALNNINF